MNDRYAAFEETAVEMKASDETLNEMLKTLNSVKVENVP